MASSSSTSAQSRDFFNFDIQDVPEDYYVVLPPLPRGISVLNTLFLHAEVVGRPYRVEDFRGPLASIGVLKDLVSLRSYHINHVWIATLRTAEAKRTLLEAGQLQVKERKCFELDPNRAEGKLKVHWVPHHVPDATLSRVLEGFGKVEEVTRDFWRVEGFEGVESTTRIVRMSLRPGLTLESLPHQLQHSGGSALVVKYVKYN